MHERGVVPSEPGLYFIGLPFQYSKSSDVLPGIGRDHAYIAKQIAVARSSAGAVTGRVERARPDARGARATSMTA